MRLLENFIEAPWAGAAGLTLLYSLWEGAIVAAALAAALLVMRSPRLRYAAACLAMLVMLGGFGLTFVHMMPEGRHLVVAASVSGIRASDLQNFADVTFAWRGSIVTAIAPWLVPFWIAGMVAFYLRHAAGLVAVHRLRQCGVCQAPEQWEKRLTRLSAQLHLSRPISLLESCLADAPMVVGHLRPLILMPVGVLSGLPASQIEAILLHELAHIRRHDYLVNTLQRLVEGLLFYHPAVWWISRVIRVERENCCDDAAVSLSGNAHEYASALAALEENRWSGREPAVAATGGSLVKRIRRLLYPKTSHGAWTPLFAAVILIATAAISLGAWQSEQPDLSTGQVQTDEYSGWLNQEVVYIINDGERAAFGKLTTDDERDKFIEQFWARRDPTPGTVENEFKKEHYRRIAYANRRFQTASGRPGWQTDRGHMYIVYGPPDELDSHPNPPQKGTRPFEIWTYRHVDGIGDNVSLTFVDQTGQRDYQLAPGKSS